MIGAGQLELSEGLSNALGWGRITDSCGQSSLSWNLAFDTDEWGQGPVHVFLFLLLQLVKLRQNADPQDAVQVLNWLGQRFPAPPPSHWKVPREPGVQAGRLAWQGTQRSLWP